MEKLCKAIKILQLNQQSISKLSVMTFSKQYAWARIESILMIMVHYNKLPEKWDKVAMMAVEFIHLWLLHLMANASNDYFNNFSNFRISTSES